MGKIFKVKLDSKNHKKLKKFSHYFRLYFHKGDKAWFATERDIYKCREKEIEFKILKEFEAADAGISVIRPFPVVLRDFPKDDAIDEVIALTLSTEVSDKPGNVVYLGRDIDLTDIPKAFILDGAGGKRKYCWRITEPNEDVKDLSIQERFKAIYKMFNDSDTKCVLSMSGGGLKAFAHGVLTQFLNALGVKDKIDEIWGTSGGAIAGLWYACGIPPRKAIYSGYDLYNEKFSILLSPSKWNVLKNIISHNILPARFRPAGVSGFIQSAQSIQDLIERVRKNKPVEKPFFCIAFNLNKFTKDILTPFKYDIKEYKNFITSADPIDAVVASSSVPILFVPKLIKREDGQIIAYIDGSIVEKLPVKSIYDKWKLDKRIGLEKRSKLFVISAKLFPHTELSSQPNSKISEYEMLKIYHTVMSEMLTKSQEALFENDPDVTEIETCIPLHKFNAFDIHNIPLFIKLAYKHVIDDLIACENQLRRLYKMD
ncbi:patatin-like phospholipase family protein [Candidatus Auribacterota bacterium]